MTAGIPDRVSFDDLLTRGFRNGAGNVPLIGLGADAVPVRVDLTKHVLINLPAGHGSTTLLRTIVVYLLGFPREDAPAVDIVDPRRQVAAGWDVGRPGLTVHRSVRDASNAIMVLHDEMRARLVGRYNNRDYRPPRRRILVIDELEAFTSLANSWWVSGRNQGQAPAVADLTKISQLGPAVGVHIIVTTRYDENHPMMENPLFPTVITADADDRLGRVEVVTPHDRTPVQVGWFLREEIRRALPPIGDRVNGGSHA